ncbi:MAG: hypothetical protein ACRD2A_10250, partial [Vicinamibacterales bacterium]
MNTRSLISSSVLVVTIAAASMVPSSAQSPPGGANASGGERAWVHPQTPWGDPDIQGIWPSANIAGTPFERPVEFGDRAELTDQEFAERQKQFAADAARVRRTLSDGAPVASPDDGDTGGGPAHWGERWLRTPNRMTSLIVDPPNGRFPPVTADGRHRAENSWRDSFGKGPWNKPDDLGPYDRCISRGLLGSMFPSAYNNGNEIVQAPGFVAIRNEMVHEARVIPLDGRAHVSQVLRGYMGDSRGHWEGNTLVVQTTNFNGKFGARGNGNNMPMSDVLKVVERFSRLDADTLEYRITVDDPKTWTRPWTVAYPMKLDNDYAMFEYACHEGNYGLPNILSAARAAEAKQ